MQRQLDWDDLRVVAALGRAGSFGGASRALELDRATVMRRLDALEAALGTRLFERTRDGCTPTPHGKQLLPAVHEIETTVGSLAMQMSGADTSYDGTVRVTAPEWLAVGLLAPELGRLRARHPRLEIELVTTNQILSMTRREADIAIRNVRPSQRSLVHQQIGPFGYALYASKTYIAERGMPKNWAEHDLVLADEELSFMPGHAWLVEHASTARVAMRATETLPMVEAVRAGLGIASLPALLADRDPALTRVLPDEVFEFPVWMVLHPKLRRTARVRAVVEFLGGLFTAHRGSLRPRKRR